MVIQMNYKKLMAVLLLTAALLLTACNKTTDDKKTSADSDTDTDTPVITETDAPAAPAPVLPADTEAPADETTAEITETEPPAETTAPIPELPPEQTTEGITEAPVSETEPAEEYTPAPIVIAKPILDISGQLIPGGEAVTGQIASAQSEHIRLLLDYTVQQSEDGDVTLTLDVGLSCYELWCSAKKDMGTITVNGVSRTFSTDAIDHMVSEKTYIPFFTQTYNGTGSRSAAVEVSWAFNGKYGGADVGVLTAGITLQYGADGTAAPITPETEAPAEPTAPPTEPETPQEPATEPAETEPAVSEPTDAPVTEPVLPTEPDVPAEPNEPAVTDAPADSAVPTEPTVPEMTTEPGQPGDDTTPAPDLPPAEPEAPAGPTVTGTPEETVPAEGQDTP